MAAQVSSVFLYVDDVLKSLEFYNEIVGAAEISQVHAEHEGVPITLAILRIGSFSLMLHPHDEHAEDFADTRVGVGIHLQLRVDDVDAFYQHCLEEEPLCSASPGSRPTRVGAGANSRLRIRDGYVWSIYQDNSGGRWT